VRLNPKLMRIYIRDKGGRGHLCTGELEVKPTDSIHGKNNRCC